MLFRYVSLAILRATRNMQSSSLYLSICVLYCVYVPQVAVSDRILLYAVLFSSVVIAVGCLRLSVSTAEER
jgi:predicted lysophospholipase L1 biosynthesis ABC-type transport system permease subunit